ncbi:hypothetical protein [Streptomyces chiangmaiensis]|uniref:Integral membrane protein n=1 Tax=Streptomyces chiangmaiensis TaxID=766497 RepID=A0ABU7FGA9_9ACTN|nr:hypothetical protein [Streptomyces chiangmaiensis]MED7823115.1 hypothetical protein [Streptomyces chiangmaiensis]
MSHATDGSMATDSFMNSRRPAAGASLGRPWRDDPQERRRRHTVELLAVCALALVPWTVVLGMTLPSDYQVHAWRTTWVGFDILLLTALGATAVLGKRRHRAVVIPALSSAVLLVCDAWFDVSLALGTPAVWASAALAVFVELPMAAFLFHRMYGLLGRQWTSQPTGDTAGGEGTDLIERGERP